MFDAFKKKLRSLKGTPEKPVENVPSLFGLHLGGSFELNDLKMRLIEDKLIFQNAAKTHIIGAVGVVALNDGSYIVRYYTDDDGFLQFVLDGGLHESNVVGCKLWYFYETTGISSDSEWTRQIDTGISQKSRGLEGKAFVPIWKDAGGLCPPVAMTERTYTNEEKSGETSAIVVRETDQFVMVYETRVQDDLYEYLMVSGEESINNEQVDRCLVHSTGIDLSESDIEVIG